MPVEIPRNYVQQEDSIQPGYADSWNWIEDFQSPELKNIVHKALTYNYDLEAAAIRMDMAAANSLIAGSSRLPSVNGDIRSSRNKRSSGDEFRTLRASTIDSFSMGFNWNWEIDLWGRLKNQKQSAIASEEAAAADYQGARLSITGAVTRAWLALRESIAQQNLAEETYQNYLRNQEVIFNGYKEGIFSALDLSLIRANVESSRSQWEARKLTVQEAARSLQILLGEYPDGAVPAGDELPVLNRDVPAGLPSDLLTRRPDLIAAERRLAAAIEEEKIARKGFLPQIRLTGNYGVNSQELENLLEPTSVAWTLASNLTQPIFNGGRLWGTWNLRRAQSRLALSQYARTALQAFLEVESALQSEQSLNTQVEALGNSADENEKAADLAWKNYERGLTDSIITVLEARRRASNTRSQYLQTRRRHLQNRVDLHTALGGPFNTNGDNQIENKMDGDQDNNPDSESDAPGN